VSQGTWVYDRTADEWARIRRWAIPIRSTPPLAVISAGEELLGQREVDFRAGSDVIEVGPRVAQNVAGTRRARRGSL
jgi:hypothetical protein